MNGGASALADAVARPASRPSRRIVVAEARRRRVPRCISRQPFARTGHSHLEHPQKRADESLPTTSRPLESRPALHCSSQPPRQPYKPYRNPANSPTPLHSSCYLKKQEHTTPFVISDPYRSSQPRASCQHSVSVYRLTEDKASKHRIATRISASSSLSARR